MLKQLVDLCVKNTILFLHRYGYIDANNVNIWTNSIYTFQLQSRLEKYLDKEIVRLIIKDCHLNAIKLCSELKEY